MTNDSIQRLSDFMLAVEKIGKDFGVEVKRDRDGVVFWPTYDSVTGGLGEWFALYVKAHANLPR
jgi:hypothetical protein